MEKITIIESRDPSDWVSCKSIRSNLLESYFLLEQQGLIKIDTCRPLKGMTEFELFCFAEKIAQKSPQKIIFIDHDPSLLRLINCLNRIYGESGQRPKIVFHVYGDFMIQVSDWIHIEDSLKNFEVRFVTSSSKQKELVGKCLVEDDIINTVPFPVNFEKFYYSEQERKKEREDLGVKDDEFLFIYSGRLSIQKNDLALVRAFLFAKQKFGLSGKLLLVGPLDDLGVPYFGYGKNPGAHYFSYQYLFSMFPEELTNDVVYIGNVNSTRLNSLLSASDCFASISAHNDEDYGMAVAEAGASGLKMILSDWGGYHDLGRISPDYTNYVPLELSSLIRPKFMNLTKSLVIGQRLTVSSDERKHISQRAKNYNSIEAVSEKLKGILREDFGPFKGFSETFYKVESIMQVNKHAPFVGASGKPSQLYRDLYEDYGHLEEEDTEENYNSWDMDL